MRPHWRWARPTKRACSDRSISASDSAVTVVRYERNAFQLAHALPARTSPFSEDEVADAVASLHPALEIGDTVFQDVWASTDGGTRAEVCGRTASGGGVLQGTTSIRSRRNEQG